MKPGSLSAWELLTKNLLGLATALAFLMPAVAKAASTVTFDNQSGKPALVKLVGPTALSVTVENGKKESVSVVPGHYFIKVRYGTPGAYSYSKGDEFDVTETATAASSITITLHRFVAGNYEAHPIAASEFGDDQRVARSPKALSPPSQETPHLVLYTNLASNAARISPPQATVVHVVENADKINVACRTLSLDQAKQQWDNADFKNGGKLEDTVVLVCDYTVAAPDQFGLWLLQPRIVGLSHMNAYYAGNVRPDFTVPALARTTRGFASVMNMSNTETKEDLGCAITGEGTITYIWVVPSMKTRFRVVFPPFDEMKAKKHEIALRLDAR